MTDATARPRRRRTPEDWADAALGLIAEGGLAAVTVDALAARVGTTKGSLYHHFAGREALLDAALARWEDRTTTAVLRDVRDAAFDPAAMLRLLIVRVVATAEQDPVGLALLASAHHPAVAPVLERVTDTRLAAVTGLFTELGFAPDEARSRALLAYSAFLGHGQLAHSTPGVLPHAKEDRRAYLDQVVRLLSAR
ncbi:TetR/AcrR family transcriptional regulator [Yinghuangia seranimata]|uniref:TetR/AcrR family transcriptional regulator n=1 Tax=Yinghuangia seranimata TaxID=408067 RepID=UPI00248D2F4E|nr:TetR/AcrR family transcriptional regulator [Yinghuangia seranimata]MDI2125950.1 TetR/AcrR family transcriptional regulator [Yinghuangia seranimata]